MILPLLDTTYSSNSEDIPFLDVLAFFSSALGEEGQTTPSTSERALQSFVSYCTGKDDTGRLDFFTIVADWLVRLQMNGVALGTAARYVKGLSGCYTKGVKEGALPKTDVFKSLMDKLKQGGEEMWGNNVTRQDFDAFLTLTKASIRPQKEACLAEDIILYSMINGMLPLGEVAMLKVDEVADVDTESLAIVNRHREPARRYVFPLRQSMLTKRQLNETVNRQVMDYLRKHNVRCFASADETLKSYWVYAALRTGIAPHTVNSVLGSSPDGLRIMSLFPEAEADSLKRSEVNASVAGVFRSNPLQWYAMRLRTRVSFADLKERFAQLKDELQTPEMFYPVEEISKRTGKKLVIEKKPILGNIIFFRARVTDILPMFYRIGDLAWCYKYTNEQGSAYAAIPQESFVQFQQAIGHFTSGYEVAPIGDLKPKVNDRVVVLGGPFQGINAVVQSIESQEDENIIYRLHFIGDNGIDFRLSLDSRMVKKG